MQTFEIKLREAKNSIDSETTARYTRIPSPELDISFADGVKAILQKQIQIKYFVKFIKYKHFFLKKKTSSKSAAMPTMYIELNDDEWFCGMSATTPVTTRMCVLDLFSCIHCHFFVSAQANCLTATISKDFFKTNILSRIPNYK